jgi:hypothetical protein
LARRGKKRKKLKKRAFSTSPYPREKRGVSLFLEGGE